MTLEEQLAYRRACAKHPVTRIVPALRGEKDTRQWTTPPTPGDLRKRLDRSRPGPGSGGPASDMSFATINRRLMDLPRSMTDQQVRHEYCRRMHQIALNQYGHDSTTTIHWENEVKRYSPDLGDRLEVLAETVFNMRRWYGLDSPHTKYFEGAYVKAGGDLNEVEYPLEPPKFTGNRSRDMSGIGKEVPFE